MLLKERLARNSEAHTSAQIVRFYRACVRELQFVLNLLFIFICCWILGQIGKTWLDNRSNAATHPPVSFWQVNTQIVKLPAQFRP